MDFYRTGKGSHRHADWYCANNRRAIMTGDVLVIPASEVKDWAPCEFCCTIEDQATHAATVAAAPAKPAMCRNFTVANTRRLYSTCTDCGKEGKVLATGNLRAHQPLSA